MFAIIAVTSMASLQGDRPCKANENLTSDTKRIGRIALLLRTREGIAASELEGLSQQTTELVSLGLL
jgi:hypothetical protein